MTFNEALSETRASLATHHCEGADTTHESTDLLSFAASMTREKLLISGQEKISTATLRKLRTLVAKRLAHTPLAHLLGKANFYGHEFTVTKATLIPRPATELLLDAALTATPNATTIIDIGTGSGCIATSAALARPNSNVIAIDISKAALQVAKKNAHTNGAKVTFLHGDLLIPVIPAKAGIQSPLLIIANLPYIPSAAYKKLSLDIRKNEPRSALVSGKDGLAHYRRLLTQLKKLPHTSLTLACEILPAQLKPLSALITKSFPSAKIAPVSTGDRTIIGIIASL